MHYVIGDVHGCYQDMIALVKRIEYKDPQAQIIFLGDLVDRGLQVWDVLEWALAHVNNGGRYISVMGNHEDQLVDWYGSFCKWWRIVGRQIRKEQVSWRLDHVPVEERYDRMIKAGMPAMKYDFGRWALAEDCLTPEGLAPYIDWFRQMPLQVDVKVDGKDDNRNIFHIAHAWVPMEGMDQEITLEEGRVLQDSLTRAKENITREMRQEYMWSRHMSGFPEGDNLLGDGVNHIIVHGHTPTLSIRFEKTRYLRPGMIGYRPYAIAMDGGCCYGVDFPEVPCMLCGLCLETLEEFYPYDWQQHMQKLALDHEEASAGLQGQEPRDRQMVLGQAKVNIEEYQKRYMTGKFDENRLDLLNLIRR